MSSAGSNPQPHDSVLFVTKGLILIDSFLFNRLCYDPVTFIFISLLNLLKSNYVTDTERVTRRQTLKMTCQTFIQMI